MKLRLYISCKGNLFTAFFDDDEVEEVFPDTWSLSLEPEDIDKLIEKLNTFKATIGY